LLPAHRDGIAETLADPDEVRKSARFANARLFTHQFDTPRGGKQVVVVVVSDTVPAKRHWIITAYLARRLVEGESEWKRH
jgi:hypothetical protein